jgi:16S rRNA (uracil1498-N3)-methyltransferase
MARRRFFVDAVHQTHAYLTGDDAHHLARVLRAEPGQQYEISDDASVYLAEIESVEKNRVVFRVVEELPAAVFPVRLTLFMALIKFDRFEWIVEKATELGVERIIPVAAERSEKGLEKAANTRLERWRKIARESGRQSRRARLPEIAGAIPLARALPSEARFRFFLEEEPGAKPLLSALPEQREPSDTVAVLIGPEGGWIDAERNSASASGWTPVSLGPAILRAETAAIAALAVITNAWLR